MNETVKITCRIHTIRCNIYIYQIPHISLHYGYGISFPKTTNTERKYFLTNSPTDLLVSQLHLGSSSGDSPEARPRIIPVVKFHETGELKKNTFPWWNAVKCKLFKNRILPHPVCTNSPVHPSCKELEIVPQWMSPVQAKHSTYSYAHWSSSLRRPHGSTTCLVSWQAELVDFADVRWVGGRLRPT